ncbi:unnamed protein product [Leuciscus chuanchicus]
MDFCCKGMLGLILVTLRNTAEMDFCCKGDQRPLPHQSNSSVKLSLESFEMSEYVVENVGNWNTSVKQFNRHPTKLNKKLMLICVAEQSLFRMHFLICFHPTTALLSLRRFSSSTLLHSLCLPLSV